ncbi:MAG TPA: DUF4229 domain-containing protein [Actinotalea sp.]|nr:DUF4229 domain-containing protein [Actinotalea sp.]
MPLVVYSALRLAILLAALAALWAVGMGGWLLVVVAALAAWAISFLVLAGPRDRAALWLAERAERRRAAGTRFTPGVEADALAEDAEARAVRSQPVESPPAVAPGASQSQAEAEQDAVGELEEGRPGKDRA